MPDGIIYVKENFLSAERTTICLTNEGIFPPTIMFIQREEYCRSTLYGKFLPATT